MTTTTHATAHLALRGRSYLSGAILVYGFTLPLRLAHLWLAIAFHEWPSPHRSVFEVTSARDVTLPAEVSSRRENNLQSGATSSRP